jgi:hypothetical protein
MPDDRLGDLLANCEDRVERRHRLLKDHRDLGPAHLAQFRLAHFRDLVAGHGDPALDMAVAPRQQADQRAQRDGLPRTGFTEDAKHTARLESEVDAIDGAYGRIGGGKADPQTLDRHHRDHAAHARLCPEPDTSMWQATARPSWPIVRVGGTSAQTASANGQRVRKRQPEGGLIGFGGSPLSGASIVRRRGSIDGIADNSAFV